MIHDVRGCAIEGALAMRPAILAHVVNDVGAFGRGFAGSIARRWPEVARGYKGWRTRGFTEGPEGTRDYVPFLLGNIMFSKGAEALWVAHLLAQQGLPSRTNLLPLNMNALTVCLRRLAEETNGLSGVHGGAPYTVHMPRIGCGLARGDWAEVRALVESAFGSADAPDCTIYTLEG